MNSYDQVTAILDKLFGDAGSANDVRTSLDPLSHLADLDVLTNIIREVQADSAVSGACAADSFEHPLGFDTIALIETPGLFSLRIHAWWSASKSSNSDHIHNHRSALASSMLCGSYDMQIYAPDRVGPTMIEYQEQIHRESGWSLRPVGESQLRTIASIRFKERAAYTLPAEVLHGITIRAVPCITLFLQSTPTSPTTRVFAKPGAAEPVSTPRRPLSPETYVRRLDRVLDALSI